MLSKFFQIQDSQAPVWSVRPILQVDTIRFLYMFRNQVCHLPPLCLNDVFVFIYRGHIVREKEKNLIRPFPCPNHSLLISCHLLPEQVLLHQEN
jgi:hypothetical protein